MRAVLTSAEMREADRRTIEEIGLPGAVLMENAGAAAARVYRERFGHRRPAILCGKGNNGGDGFVVARHLLDLAPRVHLLAARGDVKGDARLHMGAYERSGGLLVEVPTEEAWARVRSEVLGAPAIVDGLLGTGLRQAPAGLVAVAIRDLAESAARVLALDVPSGVSSDAGDLAWPAVRAEVTVAFAAPKYGHVLPPACDRVGALVVADIGIPSSLLSARLWLAEAADLAAAYPRRAPDAHKGTFGHVLVIAGSVGKTGAAILSATAALRAGAGLVTVATPEPALATIAAGRPELMTEPLPAELDEDGASRALALAKGRDAVVIGPGLGQDAGTRAFVRAVLENCTAPLLLDADALNALAPSRNDSGAVTSLRRKAPTIVTPHPGEMARLTGSTAVDVQRRRLETARAFAMETGAVVVLKGQRTVVADGDGRAAINPTGNPGLAKGGTGDVLSGVVGALLGRGLDAWQAALAGVFLHGRAGDLAAEERGQEALLAGDVVEALGRALKTQEAVHS